MLTLIEASFSLPDLINRNDGHDAFPLYCAAFFSLRLKKHPSRHSNMGRW